MTASLPVNETGRLNALQNYNILDTPSEAAFDRITRLAALLFKVPISLISLVDRERQWFKSCYGLNMSQVDRKISFCAYAILSEEVLVVPDATQDERFGDNDLVTGKPHIRFYAGAPLKTRDGFNLGSLCIIDTVPRSFSDEELSGLSDLAALVTDELELRQTANALRAEVAVRKLNEERLRLLEMVVIKANDAILISEAEPIDEPGPRIVFVNEAFTRMTGYSSADVVGKNPRLLQGPDTDRGARDEIRAALEKWRPVQVELLNYRKDGTPFWVELSIVPVANESGWFTHWVSIQRDMDERKQTEAALQKSEVLKTAILDTALDCIVSMNHEGNVVEWNPAAEGTFGYSRQEALGKPLGDLIVPESLRDLHYQGLEHYLATGEGPVLGQRIEVPALRADGAEILVELSITRIATTDPPVFTAYLRDITERKQNEDKLKAAKSEAERANRAKSEFLSRMSHELRTPMNAILGFTQLLEMDDLNEEQRHGVGQILKGGRHLLKLINEVLDISRIEAGRLSVSPEPVRVSEVVSEALELVQALAGERGIRVENNTELDAHHVMADRQRLKQILLNLLSNAVKYNRENGLVQLSCLSVGERVRFEVSDTGSGISADNLEKLFVPFERLGAEHSSVEGTGIGLSICQRLAELMSGAIGVQSTAGEGSTFWVELPQAEDPLETFERGEHAQSDLKSVQSASSGTSYTVLYIEDNLSNLSLVKRIFARRPEIRLLPAMQGRRGLELAREHQPDLILLDLHLPDIQGDGVLQQLRAQSQTRDIPVVMLSADATPHQIERLLAAGASEYLTKPLDIKRFLQVVEQNLEKARR